MKEGEAKEFDGCLHVHMKVAHRVLAFTSAVKPYLATQLYQSLHSVELSLPLWFKDKYRTVLPVPTRTEQAKLN